MRRLSVGVDRERVVDRIDAHRDTARLDRVAAALVQPEAVLDAVRRFGECAIDVAVVDALSRHEIVRAIQPGLGCAGLKSGERIDHRRQLFEIEHDQGERVLGDAPAAGHHHRHGLAGVGDLVLRQHIRIDVEADRAGRQRLRDAVRGQQRPEISERQHRVHAGKGLGRARVDAVQSAVSHRAAQERDMQRAWDVEVVDEAAQSAQQRPVLDARQAAAEQRCWCRRHLVPLPKL